MNCIICLSWSCKFYSFEIETLFVDIQKCLFWKISSIWDTESLILIISKIISNKINGTVMNGIKWNFANMLETSFSFESHFWYNEAGIFLFVVH